MKLLRNLSTKENRDYWRHIDDRAAYVNAHFLCFSNMCVVNRGQSCNSPNNKSNRYARDLKEAKRGVSV